MAIKEENNEEKKSISFVEQLVEEDLAQGKNGGRIQTRFPPEPNGYLHIGHAKAICMDFGVAEKYNGICNLRFDDTNPSKENNEYVENILNDIQWLGFKWGQIYYASDYFEKLWEFAVWMIKKGHAYIDQQTSEEIASQKGTPTTPGTHQRLWKVVWFYVQSLIWQMQICTSATQSCTELYRLHITEQAQSGTVTQCMTSHMGRVTTSKASLILSVRWNLFLIAHYMTSSLIS